MVSRPKARHHTGQASDSLPSVRVVTADHWTWTSES